MLTPYDLGNSQVTENCQKINIDNLVNKALNELKLRLIQSQIQALGIDIALTTSKTKFNGERIWFLCPNCEKRVGILYKHPSEQIIGCRICLGLKYKAQRFKGMTEVND